MFWVAVLRHDKRHSNMVSEGNDGANKASIPNA